MKFLKNIEKKPVSVRYLYLTICVVVSMIFIGYLEFISFKGIVEEFSKSKVDNSGKVLELLSIKDSLKTSLKDFSSIFSKNTGDIFNNLNSLEREGILKNQNTENQNNFSRVNKKDFETKDKESEVLNFPNNY